MYFENVYFDSHIYFSFDLICSACKPNQSRLRAFSRFHGGTVGPKDATFPQMSTSGGSAGFGRAYSSRGGSRGSSHGVSEAVSVADLEGLMFE